MADFCRQCSLEHFGRDFRDLAGLCAEGNTVAVLCEGCEDAIVDPEGKCHSDHCRRKHAQQLGS